MLKKNMSAKVLTLATSKGGAGKSTLVRNLAAYWINIGFRVAVIDADPQGSIINRPASEGTLAKLVILPNPEESVSNTVEEISNNFDYILIDTGGFRNKTTVMALLACQYALIPLKPSSDDFVAAVETCSLIKELNRTPERIKSPIKYRMIITMSQQGTIIARHVRLELQKGGFLVLTSEMYHRVAYPETAITGTSPCIVDPDGAAARDVAKIAVELGESFD